MPNLCVQAVHVSFCLAHMLRHFYQDQIAIIGTKRFKQALVAAYDMLPEIAMFAVVIGSHSNQVAEQIVQEPQTTTRMALSQASVRMSWKPISSRRPIVYFGGGIPPRIMVNSRSAPALRTTGAVIA
jgi:hypothetical protein